jgi:hypothetical protein
MEKPAEPPSPDRAAFAGAVQSVTNSKDNDVLRERFMGVFSFIALFAGWCEVSGAYYSR